MPRGRLPSIEALASVYKIADGAPQSRSDFLQYGERRVSVATFYAGDIGPVQARRVAELFLGPTPFFPESRSSCGKARAYIHRE